MLAAASVDKTIRFWDTRANGRAEQVLSMRDCEEGALSMSWAPNGHTLAVGTRDDRLVLIDARRASVDARRAAQLSTIVQPYEMNQIAWAPTGPAAGLLFVSAGSKTESDTYTGRVDVMALAGGGEGGSGGANKGNLVPVTSLVGHNAQIHSLAFDRSGTVFTTGSADSTIVVWSVEDMAPLRCFDRLEYAPKSLSFSYDGAYLASASDDRIVDVVRGRLPISARATPAQREGRPNAQHA